MAQNIYDNPNFFEKYSQLNRQTKGLEGAPEWETVKALLPDLREKRIVDLGCGFGWFCRYALELGAQSALGIDLSQNMIEKAQTFGSNPAIKYEINDLETIQLPKESFDFVYSSLTFHYIQNFPNLMKTIYDSLTPRSHLVFTNEHPIYMAPTNPNWSVDKDRNKIWPLNQYSVEGQRTTDWLAKGVVKQHRTLGTILNTVIDAGFEIGHIEEWKPSDEQLSEHPDWAEELNRPMYLIVSAQKKYNTSSL